MTIFCGRQLLGLLLVFIFAQSTAEWWWRDWLFNDCLRPAAEYLVGRQLKAEVRLAEVQYSSNRLLITGISVEQPQTYRFSLAGADIRFTWGNLWRGQLETVRLQSPHVEIQGLPSAENRGDEGFPEYPPLEIADLIISDGELLVHLGNIRQEIHQVNIDLQGTRQPRFEASARLGEGAGLPIALSGSGTWDKLPGITLTRFDWNGAPLLQAPLQFQLDSSGASVTGKARLPRLSRAELEQAAAILALPLQLPADVDFTLQTPELALAIDPANLDIELSVPAARVHNEGRTLNLSAIAVGLHRDNAAWNIKGRFTLEKSVQSTFNIAYAQPQTKGDFTCVVSDFGTLAGRFEPKWKEQLRGGGLLKGTFSIEDENVQLSADLSGRRASATNPDYLLDFTPLQAHLTAEILDHQLKGRLLLADRELISLTGTREQLNIELKPISLAELDGLAGPALWPESFEDFENLSGTALLLPAANGRWQGEAEIRVAGVKDAGIEVRDLAVDGKFRLQPHGISLTDLHLTGQAGLPGGSAQVAMAGSGIVVGDNFQFKLAALELTDAEYFSDDGTSGLTEGRLSMRGQISGNLANHLFGINLAARLGAGEVLYGPFYASFDGTEARIDLAGGIDLNARKLSARSLEVEIPDLASARIEGTVSSDLIDLGGSLKTGDLGLIFDQFLKGTVEALAPALKDLTLTGTLDTDFALRRSPENLQIRANLQPRELGLALASSDLEISGANGLLPLNYSRGQAAKQEPAEPLNGVLYFASFQAGPARLENTPLHLLSSTNRLEIREFPICTLADGQIRITDLTAEVVGEQPTLAGHIRVDGIDLKTLTRELDTISMAGTLSADLGEIHYADRTLSSAGQATISAFGGTTVISNIRLRDPASRYRTLLGDVDFSDIDLYRLTRTFEFGEMNGILDGYIHNLRLFGTVPSQFDAKLATRDTGRRNISVKAINNLAILSQGGLSAALSRGIYRFIDFYRYQKIGLHCSLNNDVFRLQGTAREDTQDYLVYGGLLPPKIDIIAPGRDISFKEMLKRLSRIDRAGR